MFYESKSFGLFDVIFLECHGKRAVRVHIMVPGNKLCVPVPPGFILFSPHSFQVPSIWNDNTKIQVRATLFNSLRKCLPSHPEVRFSNLVGVSQFSEVHRQD